MAQAFAASLNLSATVGADGQPLGVDVLPVAAADGTPYLAAHTVGMRSYEADGQPHVVAIYGQEGAEWQEIERYSFSAPDIATPAPDYLGAGGVMQIDIEPTHIWLQVDGGVGAHSGTCNILSFDGATLRQEAAESSSSPGVCSTADVNGDGQNEVVVDATDYYVFCYACGVRAVYDSVLRWDGEGLTRVELQPLPKTAPIRLRTLNNRTVRLAEAGLWKDALANLDKLEAAAAFDPNSVVGWNVGLIRHNGEARRAAAQAPEQAYPLMTAIFYGDYAAAVEVMRPYGAEGLFSQPPAIISGTVAQGWEESMAGQIISATTAALQVKPLLAEAYFVRGWATWLADPADPAAREDIQRAAALRPDDVLFADSLEILENNQ